MYSECSFCEKKPTTLIVQDGYTSYKYALTAACDSCADAFMAGWEAADPIRYPIDSKDAREWVSYFGLDPRLLGE